MQYSPVGRIVIDNQHPQSREIFDGILRLFRMHRFLFFEGS